MYYIIVNYICQYIISKILYFCDNEILLNFSTNLKFNSITYHSDPPLYPKFI